MQEPTENLSSYFCSINAFQESITDDVHLVFVAGGKASFKPLTLSSTLLHFIFATLSFRDF